MNSPISRTVAAFALVLSLAACGGGDPATPDTDGADHEAAHAEGDADTSEHGHAHPGDDDGAAASNDAPSDEQARYEKAIAAITARGPDGAEAAWNSGKPALLLFSASW